MHCYSCISGSPTAPHRWRVGGLRYRSYQRAWRWLRGYAPAPDLVHGHILLDGGIVAARWAQRWGCPCLISEHSSIFQHPNALGWPRSWLLRWASRRAAAILPVTKALEAQLRDRNRLPGSYQVVSNVVNTELFNYAIPPPLPLQGGPFRWLHISNFVEADKNISGLLRGYARARAATAHQDWQLHFGWRRRLGFAGGKNPRGWAAARSGCGV
ncbi:MAG: glycosyltransferase family 4 protein [Lewinella sp.]|nr:glycosyltransferase family 4 protein [Lewinella sp.]